MKLIKILSVVGCALLFQVSQAQVRFDFGLKGGLNFASLNTSSSVAQDYNNRTGYHVGAYAMLKFTKFAIQPEVLFSKQGQTYSFPTSSNLTADFSYINIPIMLKFYLAEGLNLQAGPQFGFLANQTSSITALTNSGTLTTAQLKDFVKSSDVSLALGAGWDLPFGLNITARYNLGLSDINKITGTANPAVVSSLGTTTAKNQVIMISVGYRLFKLGK
ncbi:MAG: PorT family protein [Bacteroidetes bacterium]|nr:PorT family protein [Bacteroidota bacterium]